MTITDNVRTILAENRDYARLCRGSQTRNGARTRNNLLAIEGRKARRAVRMGTDLEVDVPHVADGAFTFGQEAIVEDFDVDAFMGGIDHAKVDAWVEAMEATLDAPAHEVSSPIVILGHMDDSDPIHNLATDECGWGANFDPADVQWGFTVRTR